MRSPIIFVALFAILFASCASSPDSDGEGLGLPPEGGNGDGPAVPVSVPSVTDRPVRIEWANLNPRRGDAPMGLINATSPEIRNTYGNNKAWAHVKPIEDQTMAILLGAFKEEGFFDHAEKGRGSDSLKMGEGHGAICLKNGDENWTLIFAPGMAGTPIPELYVRLKHNILHVHRTTLHLAPTDPPGPEPGIPAPHSKPAEVDGPLAILVIPARYGSKRLPGKPLLNETGKPLVVHVLERAAAAESISRAIVATDDERIRDAVIAAGGEAVMTGANHRNGTERIGEVAAMFPEEGLFVNLQGDEPEIDPADIDLLVRTLEESGAQVATLAAPLTDEAEFVDPSVVKVVLDGDGGALYFSRAPIPFPRDGGGPAGALRHVGIYGFTRNALLRYPDLPISALEGAERLEQLRFLGAGVGIRVALVQMAPAGIDTMDTYRAFVARHMASERG